MKIDSKKLGIIVLIIVFGTILITSSTGLWSVERTENNQTGGEVKKLKDNIDEHAEEESSGISGQTTFNELLESGLSENEIEKAMGLEMPSDLNKTIRNHCIDNGKSFGPVKKILETLSDK